MISPFFYNTDCCTYGSIGFHSHLFWCWSPVLHRAPFFLALICRNVGWGSAERTTYFTPHCSYIQCVDLFGTKLNLWGIGKRLPSLTSTFNSPLLALYMRTPCSVPILGPGYPVAFLSVFPHATDNIRAIHVLFGIMYDSEQPLLPFLKHLLIVDNLAVYMNFAIDILPWHLLPVVCDRFVLWLSSYT